MNYCHETRSAIDGHLSHMEAVEIPDQAAEHLDSCDDCMAYLDARNPPWEADSEASPPLEAARRAELLASVSQRPSAVRLGFGALVALAAAATVLFAVLPANEKPWEVDPAPTSEGPSTPSAGVGDSDADVEPVTPQALFREANELIVTGRGQEALEILDEVLDMEDVDPSLIRNMERMYNEAEVIGKPAGDLSTVDWLLDSDTLEGEDLRLVIFFEEWCPHCRREMPTASDLHEAYRFQGLRVIGLATGHRGVPELVAYVDESSFAFPIGIDVGDVLSTHFNVKGIPAAALVDDGVIVWRGHPGRLNEDVLHGFLER